MVETHEFVVPPEEAGRRLDVFLTRCLPESSRSQIQRLIRRGRVEVDSPATAGEHAVAGSRIPRKAGEAIEVGERILVRLEREPPRALAEDLSLIVVYEDHDLIVVDKPAGMVVHAGSGVKSGTLVNALLYHTRGLPAQAGLSSLGGELRPGIVHRLDRMTSGLVIVAKNDAVHRLLAEQFKSRTVRKTYTVLVHGAVREAAGELRAPIGRDPRRRTRMKAGGIRPREALTRYRVVRRFPPCLRRQGFTLLEAEPKTGRTHQLRVHFASLGHPIVGDTLYGAPGRVKVRGREEKTLARNFLHASSIEFLHPRTGENVRVRAPLPAELGDFLRRLDADR